MTQKTELTIALEKCSTTSGKLHAAIGLAERYAAQVERLEARIKELEAEKEKNEAK